MVFTNNIIVILRLPELWINITNLFLLLCFYKNNTMIMILI